MPSAAPSTVAHKNDFDLIQGAWASIAGPRECRLLVSGNHYAFEIIDGDVFIGTFDLQTESNPRRMNMSVVAGPDSYREQTARCIYHVEGDVLRWCGSKPGSKCELSSFPSIENDCFLSLVFKRAKSARTARA